MHVAIVRVREELCIPVLCVVPDIATQNSPDGTIEALNLAVYPWVLHLSENVPDTRIRKVF